jgi:hypothetical protein
MLLQLCNGTQTAVITVSRSATSLASIATDGAITGASLNAGKAISGDYKLLKLQPALRIGPFDITAPPELANSCSPEEFVALDLANDVVTKICENN